MNNGFYLNNRDFFDNSFDLTDNMEQVFSRVFEPALLRTSWVVENTHWNTPRADFVETDDHYLLSIDLPGFKKRDLDVEVSPDGRVVVRGSRKTALDSQKKSKVNHVERGGMNFERIFSLGKNVEIEKVQAELRDGVLRLAIPKNAVAKPRRVEIDNSKPGIFQRLLGAEGKAKKSKETG